MAIFPKVAKFNNGGYYDGPQNRRGRGGFYPPVSQAQFGGFGIEYIPTAPDVPNIGAIDSYANSLVESQAKLSEKIEKQRPDLNKSLEYISKLNMTSGEKAAYARQIKEKYDAVDAMMRNNDPYAIFTDDGKDMIKGFGTALFDPERQARGADNKRSLDVQYEKAVKNGTLQNYDIKDGMILIESGGEKKRISKYSYDPSKHKAVLKQDVYNFNEGAEKYDSNLLLNGDQNNLQQALDEIVGIFNTATGSYSNSGFLEDNSNNISALNSARRQAKDKLSVASMDALSDEYIKTHPGKFNEKEFTKFVHEYVDNEYNKRLKTSHTEKYDINDATKGGSGKGETGYLANATYVPVNKTNQVRVDRSYASAMWQDKFKVLPVFAETSKSWDKEQIFQKSFDGKTTYFYGDTKGSGQKTSTHNGEDANDPVAMEYSPYVQHVNSVLMPVYNGIVMKPDPNDPSKFIAKSDQDNEDQKGKLVSGRSGSKIGANVKAEPMEDGSGYYVWDNEKKVRYGVDMRAYNQYNVLEKKDNNYVASGHQIYEEQDLRESLTHFNEDLTGEKYNDPYLKGRMFTDLGTSFVSAVLEELSDTKGAPESVKQAKGKQLEFVNSKIDRLSGNDRDDAIQAAYELNEFLNRLKREAVVETVRRSIPAIPNEATKISGSQAIKQ